MIRLPSAVEPSHFFVSLDDAIIQPPLPPADDADDVAAEAYKTELAEYQTKIRAARQTGDWLPVTIPGKTPVKFLMRQMPFEAFAVIMGMRERGEPAEDIMLLAARLCLLEIDGVKIKFEFDQHERFGKIASLSVFEKFGLTTGLRIAFELGALALQKAHEDPHQ